jgi:hypothetical protein
VLQHRPDFMPLLVLRDAPVIKKFGSKELGRAAIDAGQHLTRTFDYAAQRFRPLYNPITQEKGGYFDRDIVDHAGACYSLFKLIKASRKEEFLKPAQSAFEFLVRRIEPPLLEPDLLAVHRYQSARLGASALTLLSLTELPDRLQHRVGVERINRLARFVVEMQESDGRFYDSYWQRLLGYMPRRPDPAFAGEALTALARYYKLNPNAEWLHAARVAANRQIARWNKSKNKLFNSWTATGLADLYEIDPEPRYAEACFAMADSLLPKQWGGAERPNPPFPDYVGGFAGTSPPRTLTAAADLQALLAAHWLAYKLGRDPKPYADGVMAAAYFLLQNQYRRDNSYYVNRPEETRGAFRGGLVDPLIRLEYNQHAIVALTGAYDVATMRETGRAPKEFMAEGTGDLEDQMEAGGKKE